MASPAKCILLASAPRADDLDWDDSTLLSCFDIGQQRLKTCLRSETQQPTPTWKPLTWRFIPLDSPLGPEPVTSGDEASQTQFLSFGVRIPELDLIGHQDFVDHSMAILDGLVSSQIAPPGVYDETTFVTNDTISFDSTVSDISGRSVVADSLDHQDSRSITSNIALTDLSAIPPATHILSIAPQTMTLNLLCAIISVSPPRTVKLRRRNAEMDILEILVGDETRAGFSVSFWLVPQESQNKPSDDLRETVKPLRPGDLVFLTNVALSAFRGGVYGQSLSKRFSRNSTSVVKVGEAQRVSASGVMAGKMKRVQRWADDFVGRGSRKRVSVTGAGGKVKAARMEEELPPDTQ